MKFLRPTIQTTLVRWISRRIAGPASSIGDLARSDFVSRELTHVSSDGTKSVCRLTFDAPHAHGQDWAVRMHVASDNGEIAFDRLAYGVDGLQAMRSAMVMARARLEATSTFQEGRLYFLDPQGGLGWDP